MRQRALCGGHTLVLPEQPVGIVLHDRNVVPPRDREDGGGKAANRH